MKQVLGVVINSNILNKTLLISSRLTVSLSALGLESGRSCVFIPQLRSVTTESEHGRHLGEVFVLVQIRILLAERQGLRRPGTRDYPRGFPTRRGLGTCLARSSRHLALQISGGSKEKKRVFKNDLVLILCFESPVFFLTWPGWTVRCAWPWRPQSLFGG